MAKDIILSGSVFTGVERVEFETPNGGKASFVDAEHNGVILCSVKPIITYHRNHNKDMGAITGVNTGVQFSAVSNLTII